MNIYLEKQKVIDAIQKKIQKKLYTYKIPVTISIVLLRLNNFKKNVYLFYMNMW